MFVVGSLPLGPGDWGAAREVEPATGCAGGARRRLSTPSGGLTVPARGVLYTALSELAMIAVAHAPAIGGLISGLGPDGGVRADPAVARLALDGREDRGAAVSRRDEGVGATRVRAGGR